MATIFCRIRLIAFEKYVNNPKLLVFKVSKEYHNKTKRVEKRTNKSQRHK